MPCLQQYIVYLVDGSTFAVNELYDLPFEDGLVRAFMDADENDVLTLGDCYVPRKNILFIRAGDVLNGQDDDE